VAAGVTVPLIWLSRHEGIDAIGPWDTGILQHMFNGTLWPHAIEFESTWSNSREIDEKYRDRVAVVVLPSRHHYDDTEWVTEQIAKLKGVLIILSSDEGHGFPWRGIRHENIKFWVQSPDPSNYSDARWAFMFGYGWRSEFPILAAQHARPSHDRKLDWFFSGQVTNDTRRRAMPGLRTARGITNGVLNETDGFAKGLSVFEYVDRLSQSWFVPCPGGPSDIDSFRLYEALECGCIPLVDFDMPDGSQRGYWEFVYGKNPLYKIQGWGGIGELINDAMSNRVEASARVSAWWQQTKRGIVKQLENDLQTLGVEIEPWAKTTVLITCSPIASHPSMEILMETLGSLPRRNMEIILALDGVRPEQQGMADNYYEFAHRVAQYCEHFLWPAIPFIAPVWLHQMRLTEMALNMATTPTVLFMEHDTPLLDDRFIDWDGIVELVENDHLDVIRFHHEELILPVHDYMMVDRETKTMLGVPIRRTRQWSQRPAVYNTDYFKRILFEYFTPGAKCFIEDRMHSFAQSKRGHRLAIYHPDDDRSGIRRSGHTDGRAGGPKYDDSQVF